MSDVEIPRATRKTTKVAEVCAILGFVLGFPVLYADNEPLVRRWVEEANHAVTGLGAHLTFKAALVACGACLVGELVLACAAGFLSQEALGDDQYGWAVLGMFPLHVGIMWALWDAGGHAVHSRLLFGGLIAYGAVGFTVFACSDMATEKAKVARKAEYRNRPTRSSTSGRGYGSGYTYGKADSTDADPREASGDDTRYPGEIYDPFGGCLGNGGGNSPTRPEDTDGSMPAPRS